MLVSQILKEKGDLVFTASPADSVGAVAALLVARKVGAMVVLDDRQDVAGIVSERDVVRIVAEQGAEGLAQPISACMTKDVVFAAPNETVDELMGRMTDRRIRHLPVCRDGKLVGIVSIGDLVKEVIAEQEQTIKQLESYIHS